MPISLLGECHRPGTPMHIHVKNSDINYVAKQLRTATNMPMTTPSQQRERHQQLLSLKGTLELCANIISKATQSHNDSKQLRVEKLLSDAYNTLGEEALKNTTKKKAPRIRELSAELRAEQRGGNSAT